MSSPETTVKESLEAFNRHDGSAFASCFAENTTVQDPQYPAPLSGREAVRKDVEDFFKSFPDIRATVKSTIAQGDVVALECTLTGTNQGALVTPAGEVPATGKSMELGLAIFTRTDGSGRIVGQSRYFDLASMMTQLGME